MKVVLLLAATLPCFGQAPEFPVIPGGGGGGGAPTGPAGGSLSGTYPNPGIANGGVPTAGLAAVHGNGANVQLSTGAFTTGNCTKVDASGNIVDAGAPCGGSGSPGGVNTLLQFNNAGSFGGIPGVSYTPGGSVLVDFSGTFATSALNGSTSYHFTCGDGQQCQNQTSTTNYAGTGSLTTEASFYANTNFAATGTSKSTHILDFAANSFYTGTAPISLSTAFYSGFNQSGSSVIDLRASYEPNESISGGTVSHWVDFDAGAPGVSGTGSVGEWNGVRIQGGTPSAAGANVGLMLGSSSAAGQAPNGAFTPIYVPNGAGTSLFGAPLEFGFQFFNATSGTSCVLCFLSHGGVQGNVATSGEDALIAGTIFAQFNTGVIPVLAAIDVKASPLGGTTGTVTDTYGVRATALADNGVTTTNVTAFDAKWGNTNISSITGTATAFKVEGINFQTNAQTTVGIDIGTVTPTTLGGTAYNIRESDTAATNLLTGKIQIPSIASSSAAQTGTLCWTTGTGNVTVDTTTTCLASLEELKDKHGSIEDALGIVMKLDPFWFSWKPETPQFAGDRAIQPGLGAHQVESIDARLAAYSPEGKLQGVRYQEIVAVLVKAIQEQQAEIDELRKLIR